VDADNTRPGPNITSYRETLANVSNTKKPLCAQGATVTGLPWFRAYSRMIDDDKLRLLAFEDRWHFVALCCLKCEELLDEPDSDMKRRRIAVRLGVQVRELEEIGRRLQEVGLVDFELNPTSWDKLQFKTDKSTDRVREWRKRQGKQSGNKVKRCSNVSVTAQDTDTDTDTEIRSPKGDSASGDAPAFTVDDFVESWNEVATACGLAKIRKLTDARRRAFSVRRREYPDIGDWQAAFRCLHSNKWMHGDNKTGWRADPDFFLQAKSFTKLVENQYGQAER
jgi:hypothetical protein